MKYGLVAIKFGYRGTDASAITVQIVTGDQPIVIEIGGGAVHSRLRPRLTTPT